jgi:hypothetical protein
MGKTFILSDKDKLIKTKLTLKYEDPLTVISNISPVIYNLKEEN